jgi:hypothetical protein
MHKGSKLYYALCGPSNVIIPKLLSKLLIEFSSLNLFTKTKI